MGNSDLCEEWPAPLVARGVAFFGFVKGRQKGKKIAVSGVFTERRGEGVFGDAVKVY